MRNDTLTGILVYGLSVLCAAAVYPAEPLLANALVTIPSLGLTFAWAPVRGSRLRRAIAGIGGWMLLTAVGFAAVLTIAGL